jgi:ferredoxin-NADP reductase
LHQRIGVGDCLLINGPSGQFTVDTTSTAPIVLVAAGIGVTPIVSMLKHVLEVQPGRSVQLFFQAQDERHWPFGRTLHAWQAECEALRVTSYFSRATTLPIVEHGQVRAGKFDAALVAAAMDESPQTQYYLCGPDAWTASLTTGLIANSVPAAQIHSESFGGASHVPAIDQAPVEPWSLTFAHSGLQIPLGTEPTTIWQAAKQSGLDLPAACHTGACGTCRLKLRAGQVSYTKEPSACRGADEVLACVAQPIGHVEVEA